MTDAPLLAAEDLVVRYGQNEAVLGVSLEVHSGEVVGLIGPDGAGKTSTLRVLGGLQKAASGRATAFGDDCWKARRKLHTRLGYLAQRFALYGDLTVNENIHFFALMYGVPEWKIRRRQLLELVGLDRFGDRIADRLSGGVVAFGHEHERFFVICGNPVPGSEAEQLRTRLEEIASMDEVTLRKHYRTKLREEPEEQSEGGSIGLLEIARRATQPLEFDFHEIEGNRKFFVLKAFI